MRMLCLWLVNQFLVLIILVYFVGRIILEVVEIPDGTKLLIILCVAVILGLILAIRTALFAKRNYYDMLSNGFIRWTSALNLWQGEWKFFFKTLILGYILYGMSIFFIGVIICASFVAKPAHTNSVTSNVTATKVTNITQKTDEFTDVIPTTDEIIQNAIRDFLQGDENAVQFTEEARQDISESTWPEVYCSVEGLLNSPAGFNDLTVKCVGPGLYKYECVCPDHGDKFEDFCTISVTLTPEGTVQINHVTWDDALKSLAALLDNASWSETDYGFNVPDIMTPSTEKWVDDVPGSVYQWTFEDVSLVCWPLLGEWAVTDYPAIDSYLTEEVKVKDITYRNSVGTVFSGYASDGRIWYMKKLLQEGGDVVHAKSLILIYPKSLQSDVEKLIEIVQDW